MQAMSPVTVEFRGDGSLTLVGEEWNRGSASAEDRPTILMLHGGGQNRFSWKNTGQILADRGFHVVALDARGHGDNDRARAANTPSMHWPVTFWPCWGRSPGRWC